MKTNPPAIFPCIVRLIIKKKTYKAEARESWLGAYSEIQGEVLQWGHFPVCWRWRLKYFPLLLCLIISSLLHHLDWVLEILVLWGEEGGWLTPCLVVWPQELWSLCESLFGLCSSYGAWASCLWAMSYRRGCADLVLPKGRAVCLHCLCCRLLLS